MKCFVTGNENQRLRLNKNFPSQKKKKINSVGPRIDAGIALLKYFKDDLEKKVRSHP